MYNLLKKGDFRWRKKFRKLPTREQLVEEIGVDWLANRMYNVMYRYMFANLPDSVDMIRVKSWEFVYIVHNCTHYYVLEIIQKEPFSFAEQY